MKLYITPDTPAGRQFTHWTTPITTRHGTSPLGKPVNSQTNDARFNAHAFLLLDVMNGLTINYDTLFDALMPISALYHSQGCKALKVTFFIKWAIRTGVIVIV